MAVLFTSDVDDLQLDDAAEVWWNIGKKFFMLRNKSYNKDLWAGQDLNINFVAHFNRGQPRVVGSSFENRVCSW